MKILVGHDGSQQADKALARAVEMASAMKASLIVLTVVPDMCMMDMSDDEYKCMEQMMTEESEKRLEQIKKKFARKKVKIYPLVRCGRDAETILKTAAEKRVNTIVVGSHGRHGAKKFLLGSVSARVVDHAPCDVHVVK